MRSLLEKTKIYGNIYYKSVRVFWFLQWLQMLTELLVPIAVTDCIDSYQLFTINAVDVIQSNLSVVKQEKFKIQLSNSSNTSYIGQSRDLTFIY